MGQTFSKLDPTHIVNDPSSDPTRQLFVWGKKVGLVMFNHRKGVIRAPNSTQMETALHRFSVYWGLRQIGPRKNWVYGRNTRSNSTARIKTNTHQNSDAIAYRPADSKREDKK